MISQLAMSDLGRIASEAGAMPPPEDVIRLNALGLRVEAGRDAVETVRAPRVIRVGGVRLHQPTIQSEQWVIEMAETVRGIDRETMDVLRAWACSRADMPGAFDAGMSFRVLKATVRAWLKSLTCTRDQLMSAYDYVAYGDDPADHEFISDLALELAGADRRGRSERSARDVLREEIVYALSAGVPADSAALLTRHELWACICRVYAARGGDLRSILDSAIGEYARELNAVRFRSQPREGTADGKPQEAQDDA